MHKVSLTNKVFTENPLLDEIVYNARQIATGVIIKDPDKADANETLESLQNGDVLIAVKNGAVNFSNFYYDEELLARFYNDPSLIKRYAADNSLIPEEDRDKILNETVKIYLKNYDDGNYDEKNSYYRTLHGIPTFKYDDETGVPIWKGLWIDPNIIENGDKVSMNYISAYEKPDYVLIHELDLPYKNILFETGTCENIVEDSNWLAANDLTRSDVEYVMHIGDREVDYYEARSAEKFALLYCPFSDSEEVKSRFIDLYEANRKYLLYTSYSEAYKYMSKYYNNFMMIFLIIQTIIDMVIELPEYIIRRDIFDTRTCRYIFESNGVKYFKDIPLKYQVSLVKNLNKLIKFKSTDKCIVDIVSLFGIDNIEVFRYYIMKDRRVTNLDDLEYFANTKDITDTMGVTTTSEDNDKNYDIRFIKVPMLDNYDEHIRTDANIKSYDSMTDGDDSWIGDNERKEILKDIKDLDFTILRSKYYSIEAVIDLTKRNTTLVYFMNMLMYNKIDKTALKVNLPNVSTNKKFDLENVIITLFSLSYIYYGVEDTILDSRCKNAQILGFNLEADMGKISSWLSSINEELTLKDFHVDTFLVPENGKIMSFNQLKDMFLTNKDCYEHIRSVLADPPSKEIYDIYKHLYNTLMVTNRNMECFVIHDRDKVDEYKAKGYKCKFIEIPDSDKYTNYSDYERDYKWLVESIDDKDLCFVMNEAFDENHLFDLYIKEEDKLKIIGDAKMAYTYREYLRYKDMKLYSFIYNIISIPDMDTRREACVNAIQTIVSYLKDYINQDDINFDTVFAGLPSISLDFIKRYVEEVIDFFKSFKIFTHGSSIIYTIDDRFDNYVQLVEEALFGHIFDKSQLIRIEDTTGGKVNEIRNLIIKTGNGITSNLSHSEKMKMIDKVWFDISTWLKKNYSEYYNSDKYEEANSRIKDYMNRVDKYNLNSKVFTEKYIKEIEDYATDAILQIIVDIMYSDKVIIHDGISTHYTHTFSEHYERWIADLIQLMVHKTVSDKLRYQDDYIRKDTYKLYSVYSVLDGKSGGKTMFDLSSKADIKDACSTIVTQEFPAHEFNL